MTTSRIFSLIAVLILGLALGALSLSHAADSSAPNITAQPGAAAPGATINSQPGDDRTLEIAPQPGVTVPSPGIDEIPSDKSYKSDEARANLDRNFNPDESNRSGKPRNKLPLLGLSVKYTTECFLGQEESGLKIVTIDPNSPASKTDLHADKPDTGVAAAASTGAALLGPLQMLVQPLLRRATEGSGDLIVAVNDHRVRSELDLEEELGKLKPGDTMYLTVIRPLPGNAHKTMKIEVKVGKYTEFADESSLDSSGAENFAY